jgi:hypothetical protein
MSSAKTPTTNNQPSMSSESVAAKIRQNILPRCYEDLLGEIDDLAELLSYNQLLQMLNLKWVCPNMAWCWLQRMGYKYGENRHCYYTDGHEQEDIMEDPNKECKEKRQEKAKELEEETLTKPPLQKNVSYNYTAPDGVRMREYHLDTHKAFCDFVSTNNKQFGGDLSIRLHVGEHPVLLDGQDESIFHQFVFSKKQCHRVKESQIYGVHGKWLYGTLIWSWAGIVTYTGNVQHD